MTLRIGLEPTSSESTVQRSAIELPQLWPAGDLSIGVDCSHQTELTTLFPFRRARPWTLRYLWDNKIRHAVCLSPAGYSTDDQGAGCPPEPCVFCTVALVCRTHTGRCYSLPLTVDDVGVTGCTTTCSFARPVLPACAGTSISLLPRIAWPLLPPETRRRPRGAELAWVDRARRDSAKRDGSRFFPVVANGYQRQAAVCKVSVSNGDLEILVGWLTRQDSTLHLST